MGPPVDAEETPAVGALVSKVKASAQLEAYSDCHNSPLSVVSMPRLAAADSLLGLKLVVSG